MFSVVDLSRNNVANTKNRHVVIELELYTG